MISFGKTDHSSSAAKLDGPKNLESSLVKIIHNQLPGHHPDRDGDHNIILLSKLISLECFETAMLTKSNPSKVMLTFLA